MFYKGADDDQEFMDERQLSLELLDSIKSIDVRIDELKKIFKRHPMSEEDERRGAITERMRSLVETRFSLMYTFMDLNNRMKKRGALNPFDIIDVEYNQLKREI
jgi:hypothetical protein